MTNHYVMKLTQKEICTLLYYLQYVQEADRTKSYKVLVNKLEAMEDEYGY